MLIWFLALGCADPGCEVEVTDIHTVLRATARTPRAERLRVAWTAEGREGSTALEAEATQDHDLLLFDLTPLVDVAWSLLDEDDVEVCGGEAQTENLPAGTPSFDATGALDGYWLITSFAEHVGVLQSRVSLLRADGAPVWAYEHPYGDEQIVSADLVPGGVRFQRFDSLRREDIASLDVVGLDGAQLDVQRTPDAHHVYTPLDDGAVAYLRVEPRTLDGLGCVVGDSVVERAADGTERVVWSSWDALPVRPGSVWGRGFYPGCFDWTHGSGLSWRAADDTLLVTLAGQAAVVHVDRASGATLATYGGPDLESSPGVTALALPHGASWTSDGRLLVFDGHDDPVQSGCYAYRVDSGALVDDRRWTDGAHLGQFLGSARELDDGRISCNWGADGFVRVFPPDRAMPDYELRINHLAHFGSATFVADLSPWVDPG